MIYKTAFRPKFSEEFVAELQQSVPVKWYVVNGYSEEVSSSMYLLEAIFKWIDREFDDESFPEDREILHTLASESVLVVEI